MDSEAWSLFTQLPVVGIFVLFTIYSNKAVTAERTSRYQTEANERALRDTSYQDQFKQLSEDQKAQSKELSADHRAMSTELLEGLRELRAQSKADQKEVVEWIMHLQVSSSKLSGLLMSVILDREGPDSDAAKTIREFFDPG